MSQRTRVSTAPPPEEVVEELPFCVLVLRIFVGICVSVLIGPLFLATTTIFSVLIFVVPLPFDYVYLIYTVAASPRMGPILKILTIMLVVPLVLAIEVVVCIVLFTLQGLGYSLASPTSRMLSGKGFSAKGICSMFKFWAYTVIGMIRFKTRWFMQNCCALDDPEDKAWTQRLLYKTIKAHSLTNLCEHFRDGTGIFKTDFAIDCCDVLFFVAVLVTMATASCFALVILFLLGLIFILPAVCRTTVICISTFCGRFEKHCWSPFVSIPGLVAGLGVVPLFFCVVYGIVFVSRFIAGMLNGIATAMKESSITSGLLEIYTLLHTFELTASAYILKGLVPGFGKKPTWICHIFRLPHSKGDIESELTSNEAPAAGQSRMASTHPTIEDAATAENAYDSTAQREARRLLLDLLLAAGEAGFWCLTFWILTKYVMRDLMD